MLHLSGLHVHHGERTFSVVQSRHHRVLDPLLVFCGRLEPVHDKFDEMRLISIQRGYHVEFLQFPVDADLRVTAFPELFEQLLVVSFAALDQRCHQVTLPVPVVLHDQRYDLFVAVSDHFCSGFR